MYAVEEYNLVGENEFIGACYFLNSMDAFELAKKIDKDSIYVNIVWIYHDKSGEIQNDVIWTSIE